MFILVGLANFVKRGVLTFVDKIPLYRNYHYYYTLPTTSSKIGNHTLKANVGRF